MHVRRLLLPILGIVSVLSLASCSSNSASGGGTSGKPTITIGSTNFEEQQVVANLYADVLSHAGYPVKVEPALGTRSVVVPAIEHNQISLEPDYAASLLAYLNKGKEPPAADQISTAIAADNQILNKDGVTVLPASKALDTNVFAVTRATADRYHLTTISSLAPYAAKMTLGGPPECPNVSGCELGLEKVYGLHFAAFKSLDEAGPISVAALKNGEVQVVELFSSDGNVVSNNFVALTDNKHLEGADYIVPVIRTSLVSSGLTTALTKLDNALTTDAISKLNLDVTVQKEEPAAVAETWLKANGLIPN